VNTNIGRTLIGLAIVGVIGFGFFMFPDMDGEKVVTALIGLLAAGGFILRDK
jgi:hypothetical protein